MERLRRRAPCCMAMSVNLEMDITAGRKFVLEGSRSVTPAQPCADCRLSASRPTSSRVRGEMHRAAASTASNRAAQRALAGRHRPGQPRALQARRRHSTASTAVCPATNRPWSARSSSNRKRAAKKVDRVPSRSMSAFVCAFSSAVQGQFPPALLSNWLSNTELARCTVRLPTTPSATPG